MIEMMEDFLGDSILPSSGFTSSPAEDEEDIESCFLKNFLITVAVFNF
jgi:hypothetical protein